MQAIQASLMEAGEGHNAQPASAGTGATSKKQPADGPDLKVQHNFLACHLALLAHFTRYPFHNPMSIMLLPLFPILL